MPRETAALVCDHPKCENNQVVTHQAHYAGWTVVHIFEHGTDGLTLNNLQIDKAYCPDHREFLQKKLGYGGGGED